MMRSLRRSGVVAAAVVVSTLSLGLMTSVPAAAMDSSSIRLSALAVNEGSPIRVEVPYLYSAARCTVGLAGPGKAKPVVVPVRNATLKASLPTKGLPPGSYVVRVNCGKDGRATSSSFSIVPKGAPTTATCDITDRGFSAAADGETTYGIQITNRSPSLTATSVILAIAFLDAAGNPLATTTDYAIDIPPGESVFEGGYETAVGVSSIRVDAVCKSSTERPAQVLRGQAQSIAPRNSSIFPVELGGVIPNPLPFIISNFSGMEYVTRNAAGAITGGGDASPDAFIPVGATGTWRDLGVMYPQNVVSVDWVMAPREA